MQSFPYLIVGGGMAADAAVKGIRAVDTQSPIGVIGTETQAPYKRPPLTKQLWKGKPVESIWLHTEEQGATLIHNRTVASIDPTEKVVTDEHGTHYGYGKLLIATGATPRRLMVECERIIYYRTFDDYTRLRQLCETGDRFAVIGGGFIGSEIAAALAMNGKEVEMLFPEATIGAKVYPSDLAQFINGYYASRGVHIRPGETLECMDDVGGKHRIVTTTGTEIEVDGIIAGIGVTPNTHMASAAGLPVENGIVVDEYLNAGSPDIFAAGDAANFYNPSLDRRIRVEHEDNAVTMGGFAGRAMAGDRQPYHYLPYFYSDLFDLGYEAVGLVDSRLETYADWQEQYQKGVIYYLADQRVRGVLLWNVWDKVPAARELISQPGPHTSSSLKGRISMD